MDYVLFFAWGCLCVMFAEFSAAVRMERDARRFKETVQNYLKEAQQ